MESENAIYVISNRSSTLSVKTVSCTSPAWYNGDTDPNPGFVNMLSGMSKGEDSKSAFQKDNKVIKPRIRVLGGDNAHQL